MLFARFLPIIGILAIAEQPGWEEKENCRDCGHLVLSTTNGMFVFLLIVVVLLIGALSFFRRLPLVRLLSSLAALYKEVFRYAYKTVLCRPENARQGQLKILLQKLSPKTQAKTRSCFWFLCLRS